MSDRHILQGIIELGQDWRKAGYAGYLTGGTLGVQPLLDAEDKYAEKGQRYTTGHALKHGAPTAVGAIGGAYAGRKLARAFLKHDQKAGLTAPRMTRIRAASIGLPLLGGLIGNHYSRKLIERDTRNLCAQMGDLLEFKDLTARQSSDRLSKQGFIEGNVAGHGASAITGGLAGAAFGGLLAGRRGVIKGSLSGAAAGLGARAAMQPSINRVEDAYLNKKRQSLTDDIKVIGKHALANLLVPTAALATGAAIAGNRKSILKATKNMARKAKVYKRAFDIRRGKPVPMKPSDYKHVVPEGGIAGLLKEHSYSAREELDSIIHFRAGYSGAKYGIDPETGGMVAIAEKKKGIGAHFNRNIGTYIGGGLGLLGTAKTGHQAPLLIGGLAGIGIDNLRQSRAINHYVNKDQRAIFDHYLKKQQMSARDELDLITFKKKDAKPFQKKKPKGKPLSKKQQAEEDEQHCMSARDQLDTILMGVDPRPRNDLGEFSGAEEGQPHVGSMRLTYGQAAATGAVSGAAGLGTGAALKALYEKLKSAKK